MLSDMAEGSGYYNGRYDDDDDYGSGSGDGSKLQAKFHPFFNNLIRFFFFFFTDTERNHDRSFDSRPNIVPVDTVGINVDSSANMLRISLFNSLASSTLVTLTLVLSRIVILFRHH